MGSVAVFGDVHGQANQLRKLIEEVRKKYPDAEFYSLGDLIDRGPDSKGVIQVCVDENIKGIIGNHDCHDDQTECLTKRGWLKFDKIRHDDLILSFDNGRVAWDSINKIIIKDYNGEVHNSGSKSVPWKVTPKHRILNQEGTSNRKLGRIWSEWKYTLAKDLSGRIRVPVSGEIKQEDYLISDDELFLIGLILSDGGFSSKYKYVQIYQSKPENISIIDSLLDKLNLKYSKYIRDRNIKTIAGRKLRTKPYSQVQWSICAESSRKIHRWLNSKRLPAWTSHISTRQFNILLDGLVFGDGTWYGKNPGKKNVGILHGTKGHLSSIQKLAVQHGWRTKLSIARKKDYRLSFSKRQVVMFETSKGFCENYKGKVWCLNVPKSNFMVRRNGAAFFSGNCWLQELIVQKTFDPFCIKPIMGGISTLLSYGVDAISDGINYFPEGRDPAHLAFELYQAIPQEHKDWIAALPPYRKIEVEGETYWLIHAGLTSPNAASYRTISTSPIKYCSDDEMMEKIISNGRSLNSILWPSPFTGGHGRMDNLFAFEGATQIFGHRPHKNPKVKGHFIAMDTGCGTCEPYRLSAIVLPSKEIISVGEQ